jgi:hypothetical protein
LFDIYAPYWLIMSLDGALFVFTTQIRHCVVFEIDQPYLYAENTNKLELTPFFELKTGIVNKNVTAVT